MCFFSPSPGQREGLKSQVEKTQVGVNSRSSNNQYMSNAMAYIYIFVVLSPQLKWPQDIFR